MKIIWTLILFYGSASIFEWLFHRCIMHPSRDVISQQVIKYSTAFAEIQKRHLQHHSFIGHDMSVRVSFNDRNRPQDDYMKWLGSFEGLYFLWPATLGVFIPLTLLYIGLNALFLGLPVWIAIAASTAMTLYQSAMWNCMHPALHQQEHQQLKWYEGIDFISIAWFQTTPMYRWLWHNHVLHHLAIGAEQCNFNVTLPLADFIFNTYHGTVSYFAVDRDALIITTLKPSAQVQEKAAQAK